MSSSVSFIILALDQLNWTTGVKATLAERESCGCSKAAGLTLEIFGILVGSMVRLFLVIGTVFQVSSLCTRWSLWSLVSKGAKDTHSHAGRPNTVLESVQCKSHDCMTFAIHDEILWVSRGGRRGFLSAVGHNSVSAGCGDRKSAFMLAAFLSHRSSADVTLSLKEDLVCGSDLSVSCCPWRAAAGAPFSAPPALQSSPPCGSARWFSGPGRLSWTPSCAEWRRRSTMTLELDQAVAPHSAVWEHKSEHYEKFFFVFRFQIRANISLQMFEAVK